MKLFLLVAALCFSTPTFSQYSVLYDTEYDGTQTSLNTVACSGGQYGLITQGYNVFGDFPSYPCIGGAPEVQWWNSPYCGSCWTLTYANPRGGSWSVNVTAINSGAQGGFSISFACMDVLTNGNAERLDGEITVLATLLSDSVCSSL